MSEISRAIYDEYRQQQAAKRGEEEIIDAVVDRVEELVRGRIEEGLGELREEAKRLYSQLKAGEMDEDEHDERHGKLLHMAGLLGDFARSVDLPVDKKGVDRMSDERTLHLPPGYVAEEWAYGMAIVNATTGDLALVVTPTHNSNEEIEEAAWEHYSDGIRDMIMKRRVAVEFVAGERAVDEVKTDLYEALEELLACAETFDEFHDPRHDWYPVLFGVRAALDKANGETA